MPGPVSEADDCLADQFARHAQRWAEEQGAAPSVADCVRRAAAALSRATSAGHVCVRLSDIGAALDAGAPGAGAAVEAGDLRTTLLASGLVATPGALHGLPFVLDDEDRFYLHRYFDYEIRLARSLARRRAGGAAAPAGADVPANVAALLRTLFPAAPGHETRVDWQQVAVITALVGRLTIISGGPGTGKTTAIVNLLACLLEANAGCRIALAAPTGKAAVRIVEAIRLRAAHLPGPLAALLPQRSFTVHRLLGVRPEGGFRHDADHPLPIDVLVIDEASMLDLALATQLFEAVPAAAKIILVGDKDQLAAVESGAVFADLSANPRFSESRVRRLAQICGVPPEAIQGPPRVTAAGAGAAEGAGAAAVAGAAVTGLVDSVVWLKHNYRFGAESAIGRLAEDIKAGDPAAVLARLRGSDTAALRWLEDGPAPASSPSTEAACGGFERYIDACRTSIQDPGAVTRAFGHFRVLCAVREGQRGTGASNDRVAAHFRRALDLPLDSRGATEWYPGRPVVVLRNDYPLRLFNGDIGIALPDAAGVLSVYFPDGEAGYRAVAPVRLPEHETAFAMTVHKAQGSEFDDVLVLLPAAANRVLTRELLYTAVTRARHRVTLAGSAPIIDMAVRSTTERLSGLAARLHSA